MFRVILSFIFALVLGCSVGWPRLQAADSESGIVTLEDFSDIGAWEAGNNSEIIGVYSPEFESMNAAKITFKKTRFSPGVFRRWRMPQDWVRFRKLKMDFYPLAGPPGEDISPVVKLISEYDNTIFEGKFSLKTGQWNTVEIGFASLNQAYLMRVIQIRFTLPEAVKPGSASFYVDNLKLIAEPEPAYPAMTEFIIRMPFNSSNINNLQDYKQLESSSPGIEVSFTVMNDADIDSVLKPQGFNYYYIPASSDCMTSPFFEQPFLYRDFVTVSSRLNEANCKGLYMHEVLTYLASQDNWNWQLAMEKFDWEWLDKMVQEARLKGKKILWAEPSYAWQYIYEYEYRDYWFNEWKDTVIPVWSTNFVNYFDQWWSGRDYSYAVAGHYGIPCGENIQSWYFYDYLKDHPDKSVFYETVPLAVDRRTTQWLGEIGWNQGARYFMVEGPDSDMGWDSEFMLGIRAFRNSIVENK